MERYRTKEAVVFVEGARQIYDELAALGVADYRSYVSFPELNNVRFADALRAYAETNANDGRSRVGSDPLASTRPGTMLIFGGGPVHRRAAQLALIQLWIKAQFALHSRINNFTNAERILRARIVTDVVSFAEGLVTRHGGDPTHKIEGLNDLLQATSTPGAAAGYQIIQDFTQCFHLSQHLDRVRVARNCLGAHVDDPDLQTLSDLLAIFDSVSLDTALALFDKLSSVYNKVCWATGFLRMHALGDEPLPDCMPDDRHQGLGLPFDRSTPEFIPRTTHIVEQDDPAAFDEYMRSWLDRGTSADDAYQFFRRAFVLSRVVERCLPEVVDEIDDARSFDLRRAHEFALDRLTAASTSDEVRRILKLLVSCAGAYPKPALEVLMRYWNAHATKVSDEVLAYTVGEIASWRDGVARRRVIALVGSSLGDDVAFEASLAAFQLWRRSEMFPAVSDRRAIVSYESSVAPLVRQNSAHVRVAALAAIAALWASNSFAAVADGLLATYRGVLAELSRETLELGADKTSIDSQTSVPDFVGVCLTTAFACRTRGSGDAAQFLERVAAWRISAAPSAEGRLNVALARMRCGDRLSALAIVRHEVRINPESVPTLVACAEVMMVIEEGRVEGYALLDSLCTDYNLTTDEMAQVEELRRVATTRETDP